jgi:hypothetical protein
MAPLKEWDPLGIKYIPEIQNEYDSYVPAIYKLLITQRPKQEIFDYLWWLETNHMGCTGDRQATEQFAERLLRIPLEIEMIEKPRVQEGPHHLPLKSYI